MINRITRSAFTYLSVITFLSASGVSAAPTAIRIDDIIEKQSALGKITAITIAHAVENAARQLKSGDALILPMQHDLGVIDMPKLPDNVQIIGGRNGEIRLQGLTRGLMLFGTENVGITGPGVLPKTALTPARGALLENTFSIMTDGKIDLKGAENVYWVDHVLGGGQVFKMDGNMTNSQMVYMRYNSDGQMGKSSIPSMHFKLHGTGQGVKVHHLIEHNQQNQKPAVWIEDAVGMALANGSTESCGGEYLYKLTNCRNVHLAQRRFYHRQNRTGWGIYAPPVSLIIENGEGNIVDGLVDIGNPQVVSLVSSDPKLQIWSSIFEEKAEFQDLNSGRWFVSFVSEAMPLKNAWSEPRIIDNEQVFTYDGPDGKVDLTTSAKIPDGITIPAPMPMPKCDIPKAPDLLYKLTATFGRAAIEAGADPTGVKPSDRALAKVLAEKNVLELGPGTFYLERPLQIASHLTPGKGIYGGKKAWIVGAGEGVTKIVYKGKGAALRDAAPGLAKGSSTQRTEILMTDLDIEGGDYGFRITGHNVRQKNITYSGYTIAGIFKDGSEPEQGRFVSITFKGGEYGFRYNGYSDKYLLYRCHFENQTKGGIYLTDIVHWHSGIYQCTFKNINGPGIAILGGNSTAGYGPWIYTVDNCTFEECGSETEPVVDFGYGWLGVFSNSTVVTKNKKVFAGFKGNFFAIDQVSFDLNLQGQNALYLGHQRFEKTAGLGMSRLTNVTTNGNLHFMPINEAMEGKYLSPDLYSDKPWAFAHVLYKVKSDNVTSEYGLFKNGKLAMDITGKTVVSVNPVLPSLVPQKGVNRRLFDISGSARKGTVTSGNLPKGIYMDKSPDGKAIKKLQVN